MTQPNADLLLFVYGTLMRGHSGHGLLAQATYRGSAQTVPRYTLLDLGAWPALWDGGATAVSGELYACPWRLVASLDAYEECPDVYRRAPVALQHKAQAQAYLLNARATFAAIGDGVWRGA